MMGLKNVKKKVEQKKAAEKAEEKKKELQEKKPEPEPAPQPAEDAGRIAKPIEKKEPRDTSVAVRDTVPEEERPTVSAPEPAEEITQNTVVSPTTRTPEEIAKESEPNKVLENVADKAIKQKKYDEALSKALKIKDREVKYKLVERIADEYAKKGEFNEAEKIAENIEDKVVRARVVMEFATDHIMESENPKILNDPKMLDRAGKILNDARKIAKEAPEGKARAEIVKKIDDSLDGLQDMKSKSYKYNEWKARRKKITWYALSAAGAVLLTAAGVISQVYPEEVRALFEGKKQKTKQVAPEPEVTKEQMGALEARLGLIEGDVDLLAPIGKSTGLYEGELDEEGELIEAKELDYTKLYSGDQELLMKGEIRKFEDVDKELTEAVKETDVGEQLEEIDSVDFEGETEITELDKVMKKLELVNAKIEELMVKEQADEKLSDVKKLLEEKKQLLKLEKILADYKKGYTDDFCGVIRIDLQDTTCEEDQWVVIRDKNGLDMRFIVYDEPTDCSEDCPTKTRKKAPPKKIKVKGFGIPQAPGT